MYSPQVLSTLKDALAAIYWYKNDLRLFLETCLQDRATIAALNWGSYKIEIASEVVRSLSTRGQSGVRDMQELVKRVAAMEDFTHLERLDGGNRKATNARSIVETLRSLVNAHSQSIKTQERDLRDIREQAAKATKERRMSDRLAALKDRFVVMHSAIDTHRRGYDLEQLICELMELYDLEPKLPFRNPGEQVDGAFTLDGNDYLLECKWYKGLAAIQDLDGFHGKVGRKLDNTLGLLVSINGFSDQAVSTHSGGRPSLLLMDGADVLAVLEERIDLRELLRRKRRRAAEAGQIYYKVADILNP